MLHSTHTDRGLEGGKFRFPHGPACQELRDHGRPLSNDVTCPSCWLGRRSEVFVNLLSCSSSIKAFWRAFGKGPSQMVTF